MYNPKQQRIQRIEELKSLIIEAQNKFGTISYKKLLAEFCLGKGLARRTTKEYMDLLIHSEFMIKTGDNLSLKGFPRPLPKGWGFQGEGLKS